jgi:cytochrome oxidase Cu insertion factor (SCO1/SenC/PrrC family)
MNKSGLIAIALLCLAAGVLTIVTAASMSRRQAVPAVAVAVGEPIPDETSETPSADWLTSFTLTERSGREFRSAELDGKVQVVNFFFSSCPSVCRMQSSKVRELAHEFSGQDVRFLSITCDPQNDTPAALQRYARIFNADPDQWLFLTSTNMVYLRRVGAEIYQVAVDKQRHSERLVVVDRWGKLRDAFHWNNPEEMGEMRAMLKTLLDEQEEPDGDGVNDE